MMLDTWEPAGVLHFFEEISRIPHGSGNEKALSDYLYSFAESRGLWVKQDEEWNIIIKKPGSKGKENGEPVILQSHMDMVCEKNLDTVHDFKTDPLALYVEDGFLKARGTTLGADNGIAVAMSLALLDDKDCVHPPLEIVITTGEEVGLLGAAKMDMSVLEGKRLINLDSGEEGRLCSSCAGGLGNDFYLPLETMAAEALPDSWEAYVLKTGDLQGGHSGIDIDKERGHAIRLLGRTLASLKQEVDFYLWDIRGGLADNAIPREARAFLLLPPQRLPEAERKLKELESTYRLEYRVSDPNVSLSLEKADRKPDAVFTDALTQKVIAALMLIPLGVLAMSLDIPGLVETSNNIGVIGLRDDAVVLHCSTRSSVVSRKHVVGEQLRQLAAVLGGKTECTGEYPSWAYQPVSPLRELCSRIHEEMYGKPAKVTAIHAGLECGHFDGKIPGIDIISMGPDIFGAHTPEERLSIPSLQRVWALLLEALARL